MPKTLLFLFSLLILVACGGQAAGDEPAAGAPRIAPEVKTLALGEMPNGEVAEREIAVRNDGDAPLVVARITTSCGCTTATLEPMTIAPSESGVLRVTFDSGAHGPDLRGPILREVVLASNDPAQPEVVVEVTATILPPEG
jgi:hypothetical protein